MRAIKPETYSLLQQLSHHPKCNLSVDAMLQLCVDNDVDFDEYALTLRLQNEIGDSFDKYIASRPEESAMMHLRVCAGTAALVCGFLTHDTPLPGADVAGMVAHDIITVFATVLGKNLAYLEPKFAKKPTHNGNQTFN